RHGNDEFAVFLSHEIFGAATGASICVFFLDFDDELFRRFEIQANFSSWSVHRRCRFLNVLRRKINKLNAGNLFSRSSRLHHFIKLEGRGVRALRVKERFQGGGVLSFHRRFVFVSERFFLFRRAGRDAKGKGEKRASYCEYLCRGCHGRQGNRLVFRTASQFVLVNQQVGGWLFLIRRLTSPANLPNHPCAACLRRSLHHRLRRCLRELALLSSKSPVIVLPCPDRE